jgi:signal transduction histidine kinase
MSTLASRTLASRPGVERGLGRSALKTERSISLIRVTVLATVAAVYLTGIGIRSSLGPPALAVLIFAGLYAFVCLLVVARDDAVSFRVQAATLLIDISLITLWVQATGGEHSQFWTLYLIVIVSAALRFGLLETIGVAVGLALLHASVLMGGLGVDRAELVYRPALLIVTGFAVGVLSYQRTVQRRERQELEALAEIRTSELGKEREEVARLRRVDLARTEFVAVAAHEFRSPLAAIIGVLSTLKTHGDALQSYVRDELIDGASGQAERLARLVEDLLTMSRIEDGVLRLSMEPIDVRDLIAEATRSSGTATRVHVRLGRVETVVCDVDAVVRVLTNLLDNARKYSPEGTSIALSVAQDAERVRFAIRDEGAGVPPEERESIFERFRRADGSSQPGAGLGLYISRGLVQAHGGELTVGDARGGGAEFAFWLPKRLPGVHAVAVGGPDEVSRMDLPEPEVTEITAAVVGTR